MRWTVIFRLNETLHTVLDRCTQSTGSPRIPCSSARSPSAADENDFYNGVTSSQAVTFCESDETPQSTVAMRHH